jgi:predicted secreted hydrolase
MVYSLRRADGTVDPFSSGNWIDKNGATHPLARGDFQIASQGTWHSDFSGANYPDKWRVNVPSLGIDLQVTPYLADQEHHLSTVYWEGAVQISGARQGQPVTGSGYVELTGYAGSLGGRF